MTGPIPTPTKLTRELVLEIRALLEERVRQVDIAEQYGISQATVSRIKNRRIWPNTR